MADKQNYYTNPAFCQQSEFQQRALSPKRHPPIGAQTPLRILDDEDYEEQEFYEEMLVDGAGVVKENKVVVVAQKNDGVKYIQNASKKYQKHRYEYIPMETRPVEEERYHRYAVIEAEEETELGAKQQNRYALVPLEELASLKDHRYEYIQESPPKPKQIYQKQQQVTPKRIPEAQMNFQQEPNRSYYQQTSPKRPFNQTPLRIQDRTPQKVMPNPIATQKLHELLSTPKKTPTTSTPQKMLSPQSMRKVQLSPIPQVPPKAQQKLNYAIGTRQVLPNKRNQTAIVAPICSSPIYSETTYSKSGSWMNVSIRKAPVQATLALAAFMMLLCGGVTTGLCFYMISIMGRLYYLDFSIVAGFTCLVLGLLGFRTRNCYWLPNRNYISGYLVLSVFSLLTCAGLLVLLVMQPKPGSPLADMTSGAVCSISVLSLILAASGMVSSYCCKYPPPDNRVQHCAQGFTV